MNPFIYQTDGVQCNCFNNNDQSNNSGLKPSRNYTTNLNPVIFHRATKSTEAKVQKQQTSRVKTSLRRQKPRTPNQTSRDSDHLQKPQIQPIISNQRTLLQQQNLGAKLQWNNMRQSPNIINGYNNQISNRGADASNSQQKRPNLIRNQGTKQNYQQFKIDFNQIQQPKNNEILPQKKLIKATSNNYSNNKIQQNSQSHQNSLKIINNNYVNSNSNNNNNNNNNNTNSNTLQIPVQSSNNIPSNTNILSNNNSISNNKNNNSSANKYSHSQPQSISLMGNNGSLQQPHYMHHKHTISNPTQAMSTAQGTHNPSRVSPTSPNHANYPNQSYNSSPIRYQPSMPHPQPKPQPQTSNPIPIQTISPSIPLSINTQNLTMLNQQQQISLSNPKQITKPSTNPLHTAHFSTSSYTQHSNHKSPFETPLHIQQSPSPYSHQVVTPYSNSHHQFCQPQHQHQHPPQHQNNVNPMKISQNGKKCSLRNSNYEKSIHGSGYSYSTSQIQIPGQGQGQQVQGYNDGTRTPPPFRMVLKEIQSVADQNDFFDDQMSQVIGRGWNKDENHEHDEQEQQFQGILGIEKLHQKSFGEFHKDDRLFTQTHVTRASNVKNSAVFSTFESQMRR